MLEEIREAQLKILLNITGIKKRYTKLNIERRNEQKIKELIIDTESCWESFELYENENRKCGVAFEYFTDIEKTYKNTILFLNGELKGLAENLNQVNTNSLEIFSEKSVVCDPNLNKVDLSKDNTNSLSTVNTMAAPNIKDIIITVNKCIPIFNEQSGSMLNAEINKFITCCESVYSMYTTKEDQNYFFSIVKTRFNGDAFDVVSQKEFKTVKELEIVLKEYFIPKSNYAEIKLNLVKAQQSYAETIFEYGKRITSILHKCNVAIKDKYLNNETVITSLCSEEEASAVKYFRNGLRNDKIRIRLSCHDISKLNLAIEKAVVFESEEKEINSFTNNNDKNVFNKTSCNFCGKPGHLSINCWHAPNRSSFPQNSFPSTPSKVGYNANAFNNLPSTSKLTPYNSLKTPAQMNETVNKKLVCFTCGQSGHFARTCRNNVKQGHVRTVNQPETFQYCQFCRTSNHSTVDCSLFTNCLKGILTLQSSGKEIGQHEDTTAAVHKRN